MFGRNCLECQGNPFDIRRREKEDRIFEFCRLREVDRIRVGVTYNEGEWRVKGRNEVGVPST